VYELASHLVMTKFRDADEDPKLHLFGQLKRITRDWLTNCLVCKGGTYPAQLKYKTLSDMACERITAGITRAFVGSRPIKVSFDPYNPVGSTSYVNFNTSKPSRWETDSRKCHINWVVLDSGWEGEFCRVVEGNPQVKAYVKNYNLGLEVPYRYGSILRTYIPDFIVLVDDGYGKGDLLRLIIEVKGYRREDAKEKKATMETYWIPGVNNSRQHGRWAFTEFTEAYQIQSAFNKLIQSFIPTESRH
jgi:type III restriction enzyme